MARSVLALGLLRADARFALRDALASIPGIYVVPRWTLPDRRQAAVYVAKDTGTRLFFDPATAQLLAADSSPTPVTIGTPETPMVGPPSRVNVPNTTTTRFPLAPNRPDAPDTQYSYAITRTSG